jgi:uncharacterized protein (TIGR00297 family)
MAAPDSRQTRKAEREARLQWQSRSLLSIVLLTSVAGFLSQVWTYRTPATAEGIAICAAFGLLVWLVRAATPLAAATGFILTGCMYLGTVAQPGGGFFHTALLPGLALFVLAFAATRFRRRHKEQVGLAESRRGRRAGQVAANMGAAAIAVLGLPNSSWLLPVSGEYAFRAPILFAALAAALAEAAADTVSSEIGQAAGGTPFLLTNGKRVPPGTDGAISVAGTAAGCVAAAIVVLTAIPTLRLDPRQAAVVWLAAIAGLFADSLIGATLETHGWLNNDLVNFVSTAIAALVAAVWLLRP